MDERKIAELLLIDGLVCRLEDELRLCSSSKELVEKLGEMGITGYIALLRLGCNEAFRQLYPSLMTDRLETIRLALERMEKGWVD